MPDSNPGRCTHLRTPVAEAARQAGQVLAEFSRDVHALTVTDKSGGQGTMDVVTDADHAADRTLRRALTEILDVPYVSEESEDVDPGAGLRWIVDPLDGTNNFLNGMPLFGTSVALVEDNRTIVAAIDLPLLNETYSAAAGDGAWLGDTRLQLSARPMRSWLIEAATQPDSAQILGNLMQLVAGARAVRILGSIAISLCWTAAGKLDLFLGDGHSWDVAAGMLILSEAGGETRLLDGQFRSPLEHAVSLSGHPDHVRQALDRLNGR